MVERIQSHRSKLLKMLGVEKSSHKFGYDAAIDDQNTVRVSVSNLSWLLNPPEVSTALFGHHRHQEGMSLVQ